MMLRRFADHRLRRDLDRAENARDQARDCARRLFRRLKATRHAQGAQTELQALRAQHQQETSQ